MNNSTVKHKNLSDAKKRFSGPRYEGFTVPLGEPSISVPLPWWKTCPKHGTLYDACVGCFKCKQEGKKHE